jgi:hypothetical protein
MNIIGFPDKKNIELGKEIIMFLIEIDPLMKFKKQINEEQIFALEELIQVLKLSKIYPDLVPVI